MIFYFPYCFLKSLGYEIENILANNTAYELIKV